MCKRLISVCRKHSNTVFVFNSIASSAFPWLNVEINEFNRIMFELSMDVENLYFLDSHDVLMGSQVISRRGAILWKGDGVHMTLEAKRVVTECLVEGVKYLHSTRSDDPAWTANPRASWPLRPQFLRQLHLHRQAPPLRIAPG